MSRPRTFRVQASATLLAMAVLSACAGAGETDPTPAAPPATAGEQESDQADEADEADTGGDVEGSPAGVADRSPCEAVTDQDVTALLGGEPDLAYVVAPGEMIPEEAGMRGGFLSSIHECVYHRAAPDAQTAAEANALELSVVSGDATSMAGYREFYEGLGNCAIEDGTTVGDDGIDVQCDTPDGRAVLVASVGVIGDAVVSCSAQAAGVDPASHQASAAAFCRTVATDLRG